MMGNPPQEPEGMTLRELVLEIRDDVKSLDEKFDSERARVDQELASRPTRKELAATAGGLIAAISLATSLLLVAV
jgi:hypothetical protein